MQIIILQDKQSLISMIICHYFMIWPILEASAEMQKYFRSYLVQIKTSKSHSEINWPLVYHLVSFGNSILSLLCSPINTLAPCAKHNVHTKTRWIDLANQLVIVIIQTHHHLQNPVKFLWLRSYRSGFLRRPLKVYKISKLVWCLFT